MARPLNELVCPFEFSNQPKTESPKIVSRTLISKTLKFILK